MFVWFLVRYNLSIKWLKTVWLLNDFPTLKGRYWAWMLYSIVYKTYNVIWRDDFCNKIKHLTLFRILFFPSVVFMCTFLTMIAKSWFFYCFIRTDIVKNAIIYIWLDLSSLFLVYLEWVMIAHPLLLYVWRFYLLCINNVI
jgi:hypothetical protein